MKTVALESIFKLSILSTLFLNIFFRLRCLEFWAKNHFYPLGSKYHFLIRSLTCTIYFHYFHVFLLKYIVFWVQIDLPEFGGSFANSPAQRYDQRDNASCIPPYSFLEPASPYASPNKFEPVPSPDPNSSPSPTTYSPNKQWSHILQFLFFQKTFLVFFINCSCILFVW